MSWEKLVGLELLSFEDNWLLSVFNKRELPVEVKVELE